MNHSHITNETLSKALFQSKLNHSSQPRNPVTGEYWELPPLQYRLASIADIDTLDLPDGQTIIYTMDDDYIPQHGKVRRADGGISFAPFQLWRLTVENGKVVRKDELTRAFWRCGKFELYGRMTEQLGAMFYQLIHKIAHRRNWRSYTYRDAFEELALEYLVRYALKYDHRHERQNPIGYLNLQITNAFRREVQKQKKHENYLNHYANQELGYTTAYSW